MGEVSSVVPVKGIRHTGVGVIRFFKSVIVYQTVTDYLSL